MPLTATGRITSSLFGQIKNYSLPTIFSTTYDEININDAYIFNLSSGIGNGQINKIWYGNYSISSGTTSFNLSSLEQQTFNDNVPVKLDKGNIKGIIVKNLSVTSGEITLPFSRNAIFNDSILLEPSGTITLSNYYGWDTQLNDTINIDVTEDTNIYIALLGAYFPTKYKFTGRIIGNSDVWGVLPSSILLSGISDIIGETLNTNLSSYRSISFSSHAISSGNFTASIQAGFVGSITGTSITTASSTINKNTTADNKTLRDNLLSFYQLEEYSGTRYDSIGNNHLSDTNNINNFYGKAGYAAAFDDTSTTGIKTTGETLFNFENDAFTISFWIKPNTITDLSSNVIIAKYDSLDWDNRSYIISLKYNPYIIFYALNSAASFGVCYGNTGEIEWNQWNLVNVWKNNNNPYGFVQCNNNSPTSGYMGNDIRESNAKWTIGGYSNDMYMFDGEIDMVGVWNRALEDYERTNLWNNSYGWNLSFNTSLLKTDKLLTGDTFAINDQLLAYWTCRETGEMRGDSGPVGYHLSEVSSVQYDVGRGSSLNYCLKFRGISGEMLKNINNNFSLENTDFTICAWMYTSHVATTLNFIAGKYDSVSDNREYGLYRDESGVWFGKSTDGTFEINNRVTIENIDELDRWLFLVGQHDSQNNQIILDINRTYHATQDVDIGVHSSNVPFSIGGEGNEITGFFYGYLDNIGIWTRLLNNAELDMLYYDNSMSTIPDVGYSSKLVSA